MIARKHEIIEKFQAASVAEDLDGLNSLIDEFKNILDLELTEAAINSYLEIYHLWLEYLWLEKWSPESRLPVLNSLFEIIDQLEKLDPKRIFAKEKGQCYEQLSEYVLENEKQVEYLNVSIEEYKKANRYDSIVRIKLKKLKLNQNYSDKELLEIFEDFKIGLQYFDVNTSVSYIFQPFDLLSLPELFANKYFELFLNETKKSFIKQVESVPYFRLVWNRRFMDSLESQEKLLEESKIEELMTQAADILEPLLYSDVDDPTNWESRGNRFFKTAEKLKDTDYRKKIFFEEAIRYFKTKKNPPDLIEKPLVGLAKFYLRRNEAQKAIVFFEEASEFYTNYLHKDINPFGFNQRWGEFLLDYCKNCYQFTNNNLLILAKEKFLLAIKHGENFYTVPFIGMALAELKLGNKDACMMNLKKAKELVFNSETNN